MFFRYPFPIPASPVAINDTFLTACNKVKLLQQLLQKVELNSTSAIDDYAKDGEPGVV